MCVCLDVCGTLLLVYIHAKTCYVWLLEHAMYGLLCMSCLCLELAF
jgi:hypothetical protein